MSPQVSNGGIRLQKLTTGELIGLSVTGVLISLLIVSAIFFDKGAAFLFWQIPNVVFATLVLGTTFILLRHERPLTFGQAVGIVVVGIVMTSIVVIVQFEWIYDFYINIDMLTSFIFRHYLLYVLPVVIMFLLGAAQTFRQLIVSCLLLVVVLLMLLVPISEIWSGLTMAVFYSINILLGFPLTVFGRQYT